MSKNAEKNEVQAQAQAHGQVAVMNERFVSDAGTGFEEAGAEAFAIPFLQILQSGSPQVKKSDGAYIKGAEEGMLYNTVTGEVFDGEKGLVVIPCHFSQRMVEWKARENGGGFVGEHLPGEHPPTEKDEKDRDILPNGNTLVDTRNHYVMIVGADGSLSPAVVAMSSTQRRKSKQWMSQMQGIKVKNAEGMFVTAPMMSRKYRITTVPESNDKGSWFGFRISMEGTVDDAGLYNAALEFQQAVRKGTAQAKYKAEETDTDDTAF